MTHIQRLLPCHPSSRTSALILGPRGTGKTTWLKAHFPKALRFDLLHTDTFRALLASPGTLASRIPTGYHDWVIIDEIQKVPALLNEVHRLIEDQGLRFVLTGSSARALRKAGVNLLAGRALTYTMHPLTAVECGHAFSLEHTLSWGQLPALQSHDNPKRYLSSYIHTYLKEEIFQEGLTRNLSGFSHFLQVAAFNQGEVLQYTNIAREISISRHTVANYFDMLDDLLLAHRLPVFTKRAQRDTITKPKFYFFDVGIYRQLRPIGPLDSNADVDGPALETLFLQEIIALNDYLELDYEIYYWRTRTQHEVDFILYGPRGFHAIEIKRKRNLTPNDFKALALFQKDYPEAQCHLLYGGDQEQYQHSIRIQPFQKAIRHLVENLHL